MMLKRFGGLMVALLVLAVVTGCASTEGTRAGVNPDGPMAQVGGSWSGYAGTGAAATSVSLTLTQNGSSVTGEMVLVGRPDFTGPVEGSVQGNALTLRMKSGTGTVQTLTASRDEINGILAGGPTTLRRVN